MNWLEYTYRQFPMGKALLDAKPEVRAQRMGRLFTWAFVMKHELGLSIRPGALDVALQSSNVLVGAQGLRLLQKVRSLEEVPILATKPPEGFEQRFLATVSAYNLLWHERKGKPGLSHGWDGTPEDRFLQDAVLCHRASQAGSKVSPEDLRSWMNASREQVSLPQARAGTWTLAANKVSEPDGTLRGRDFSFPREISDLAIPGRKVGESFRGFLGRTPYGAFILNTDKSIWASDDALAVAQAAYVEGINRFTPLRSKEIEQGDYEYLFQCSGSGEPVHGVVTAGTSLWMRKRVNDFFRENQPVHIPAHVWNASVSMKVEAEKISKAGLEWDEALEQASLVVKAKPQFVDAALSLAKNGCHGGSYEMIEAYCGGADREDPEDESTIVASAVSRGVQGAPYSKEVGAAALDAEEGTGPSDVLDADRSEQAEEKIGGSSTIADDSRDSAPAAEPAGPSTMQFNFPIGTEERIDKMVHGFAGASDESLQALKRLLCRLPQPESKVERTPDAKVEKALGQVEKIMSIMEPLPKQAFPTFAEIRSDWGARQRLSDTIASQISLPGR